ncbi:hypothetical protein N836_13715 [Leptolyngbya sp. Heron Island J]|uniref:hypothetical protein n=1 Tax=Leptolyngbya sp. Heron Island J TaxID=1385935 RepID=UPI0003B94AFE|nr:hypothetical protein [Leptolyngbya sp. Heron Island J]ESA35117.1 hypothetical protein N836_13715 [Leptolyngbya sp. Heron Island J]
MNSSNEMEGYSRLRLVDQNQVNLEVSETRVYDPSSPKSTKITVTVPEGLVDEYKERANSWGVSLSEAVAQALRLNNLIETTLKDGGAFYLADESGKVMKVEIDRS